MSKTFYATTPLYYVNAAPHIGHSYTTIAADCLARYHRLAGRDVFLLTGTDEHGQKIAQAAAKAGQPPQAFADEVSQRFKTLWGRLNIRYDDFIRTTQPRHVTAVQEVMRRLHAGGKLTEASYQGWYCMPDETFWTDAELATSAAGAAPLCPTCRRPLERTQESGWYLAMRTAQPWLLQFVKARPQFVQPAVRYNELLSLLEQPLPEYLCITRPRNRVSWGIDVPFGQDHVVYVWFDALLNYITVPGYSVDPQRLATLWPADVHLIGKDILRHHAVYWPIMLHALGLPDDQMPQRVVAHGHWKVGEQKMSKSLGNIIDPHAVMDHLLAGQPHAADIYRYFLLREVPFGQDGAFSEEALLGRLGADLANDLGNLINRTLSMVERYCEGRIPAASAIAQLDVATGQRALAEATAGLPASLADAMERLEFSVALEAIFRMVSQANQYIERAAPWKLAKDPAAGPQLQQALAVLVEVARVVAIALEPFMPSVAESIWAQLGMGDAPRRLADASRWPGLTPGQAIGAKAVLFPRQEAGKR